ncbi:MAG: hypothetical protein ACREIA_04900, partial [Opitutaceae bacterium]
IWLFQLSPLAVFACCFWWQPWREKRRELIGIIVWLAAFLVFFAFYPFTYDSWWFLRFLLPAFPALVILGSLAVQGMAKRVWGASNRTAVMITACVIATLSVGAGFVVGKSQHVFTMKDSLRPYADAAEWTREHLPPESVVAAMQMSTTFYVSTDFPVVRWDLISQERFSQLLVKLRANGRPFYAALFPFEYNDPRWTELPAAWDKVATFDYVGIWRFDPNAPESEYGPPQP